MIPRRHPNGSLEVRAHVLPHLVMPVRPFVPALRTPIIEMMSNAAIPQDLGHSVGRSAVLPRASAGHEPDVAARILVEYHSAVCVSAASRCVRPP